MLGNGDFTILSLQQVYANCSRPTSVTWLITASIDQTKISLFLNGQWKWVIFTVLIEGYIKGCLHSRSNIWKGDVSYMVYLGLQKAESLQSL